MRSIRIAALAALATAAIPACGSHTISGTATTSRDRTTPFASTVPAAPQAAPVAPAAPLWITVPDKPVTNPDSDGMAWSPQPQPGVFVGHDISTTKWDGCTLGPVVASQDRTRVGYLIAGHCAAPYGAAQYLETEADGSDRVKLGTAAGVLDNDADIDSAVIWTTGYNPAATISAVGGYQVDGAMPKDQVQQLPADTPICVDGAVTGVKCSFLSVAGDDNIFFGTKDGTQAARKGDSGGSVFLVDRQTMRATLIGLVSQGNALTAQQRATYLSPALTRLGAVAVTIHDR